MINQLFKITLCASPLIFGFFFFQKQPVLSDSYIGKDISSILAIMPKEDREKLDFFFREYFNDDCFKYVLLGEKPMALGVLVKKINPFTCLWDKEIEKANENNLYKPKIHEKFLYYLQVAMSKSRLKSIRCYETWKKYEKFFPMSQFTFLYKNKRHLGMDRLMIALVNNRAFTQKMEQHLEDFKAVFHHEMSGKNFLCNPQFFEVLMNHDGLFGTMLGFGRDNAFLFYQRANLKSNQEREAFCEHHHFDFVWNGEEVAGFRQQSIYPPCFMGNITSAETQSLRKQYLETTQTIIECYKDKDFLETTLRLLTAS